MSFFCLCGSIPIVGSDQDGYQTAPEGTTEPHVGLLPPERAMTCLKTGVRQFLANMPNVDDKIQPGTPVSEHFPHVDVFICPKCGNGFVR